MKRLTWTLLTASLAAALTAVPAHAFECDADEVGYVATFKVEEGKEAEFEALVIELTDQVHALEPGMVFYAPYRDEQAPGVYHFMERYTNAAARDAHAKADEIRAVFGQVMPLLREPLDVRRVTALCP
ncbi:MAG: antibiotic biosynthesis monooxygenase [Pseudomonadales bacterium]